MREIWPQFSTPVTFDALWFRTKVTYRKNLKKNSTSSDDNRSSSWLRRFGHSLPNFRKKVKYK